MSHAGAERLMRERFTEQLKVYLGRTGLPIRRVAQRARLPHQTLSNWTRGTQPRWHPTLPDDVRRLGLALGLNEREIDWLLQLAGCVPSGSITPHIAEGAMQSATTPPEGWFMAGGHPKDYDAGITPGAVDGQAAAYLRARIPSAGFGTIMQQFGAEAYRGQRLRMSALVRSDAVERWAGLWMRVDGSGRYSLAFDNMRDRAITGTTEWTRHAVVLDVAERESAQIAFGVLLAGPGQLWIADVRMESVDSDVPTTAMRQLRDHPINLDFGQPSAG